MQWLSVFYLWGERHKQQAFYIIHLRLHSDRQRRAVDSRGVGCCSFPLSSTGICPTSVHPFPPLAEPKRRSRGRRWGIRSHRFSFRRQPYFKALLHLRGCTGAIAFFLGFNKHKLTKGMFASYAGHIWVRVIFAGRVRHYGLQYQSGLLSIWWRSRGTMTVRTVRHTKNNIGYWR